MTSVLMPMAAQMTILGLTLLHFCWQALIIAALYKLADMALPRISAQKRYLLSLSALMTMLATAFATFVYEELRLAHISPEAVSAIVVIPAAVTGGFRLSQLIPVLDMAWLLGVAVLSLRTLSGLWFVSRLKVAAEIVPEGLAHRFAAAVRRMGLTGKVLLRLHPAIDGPFVVGAFRSVIYLPMSALTALSPEQLDAVLSHELEHIRRADYIWNLVQSAIETLFFYHPVVWWLGSCLREQRELCCDDAALKTCRDPLTYATALLSLEEQRRQAPASLVMALNGQGAGKSLLLRIARVLGEKVAMPRAKRPNALWVLPVVLLTLIACIAPMVQVAASAHTREVKLQAEADQATPAEPLSTSTANASQSDDSEVAATEMSDEEASKAGLFHLPEFTPHNIDPDVIAERARAQALKAQAQLATAKLTHIDVEAIVAQARASAAEAKAQMDKAGLANDIDVDAVAAEARVDAERAKADIARAAATEIDADKIAAEARQAAIQARADYAYSYKVRKAYVVPPAPPAAPSPPSAIPPVAPVAPVAPVTSLLPSVPMAVAEAPRAPKAPKAPKPPKALAVTPVAYNGWMVSLDPLKIKFRKDKLAYAEPSTQMLNQLPQAAPAPIPRPDQVTDVVVRVNGVNTQTVHAVIK